MSINISNICVPAVNINSGVIPSGTLSVSENGIYNVLNNASLALTTTDLLAERLNRTLISYENSNITYLPSYAFAGLLSLSSVSFTACLSIYNYAFSYCRSLITINFPVCQRLSSGAFYSCTKLTTLNFPSCVAIGTSAFYQCTSVTEVSFPLCSEIASNAFRSCYNLLSVYFPSCGGVWSSAFQYCTRISTASFPACQWIANSAFYSCYKLLSLYLNVSAVPSLLNITAFGSTPISNYTTSTGGVYGSIYVPTSLYSSFISATNWATYSDRIVSMNF